MYYSPSFRWCLMPGSTVSQQNTCRVLFLELRKPETSTDGLLKNNLDFCPDIFAALGFHLSGPAPTFWSTTGVEVCSSSDIFRRLQICLSECGQNHGPSKMGLCLRCGTWDRFPVHPLPACTWDYSQGQTKSHNLEFTEFL